MEPLYPTAPHERIERLDVLRGFALLGVFAVNMLTFTQPMEAHFLNPLAAHPSPWTLGLLVALAQGKFYALFSFLFGMGFGLQEARLQRHGDDATRLLRRRLWVLLGLGLLHGVLIWSGDILFMYAGIGFLLMSFRTRSDRALRTWILALLGLLSALLVAAGVLLILEARHSPETIAKEAAEQLRQMEATLQNALQAYGHGPFPTLFRQRLRDLAGNYGLTLGVLPQILALFLLGLLTSRLRFAQDAPEREPWLKRVAAWGLGLGLPLNLLTTLLMGRGPAGPANPWGLVALGLYIPGSTLLCLGYAAALARIHQRPGGAWLRYLAWPGRMALTCYLTHSILFTFTFNAYGLGLYGKVGLGSALLMAVSLWLALIPLCRAWLSRYRMGPAEWLWRSLTYGRAQAFRL